MTTPKSRGEHICDREQCQWIGEPEQSSTGARALLSGFLVAVAHLGCFPLILVSPLTVPLMFAAMMRMFGNECPACQRGRVVPTDSPRGQALKERHRQSSA